MKFYKLMIVALLLPHCKAFAIDAGTSLSTQCLTSLHTTNSVLTQISDNSKEHTAKLKEWSNLTAVSKESTSNQALQLIQEYGKMLKKDKQDYDGALREWRRRAKLNLVDLKNSDSLIKNAIFEVTDKITEEATLLKNIRSSDTTLAKPRPSTQVSTPQSENFLKVRLSSLLQIKQGLEATLQTNFKLYFQLRNKFDLDHPFLKKDDSSWTDFLPEIFPFQSVNFGADKGGTHEGWEWRYDQRLIHFESISLAQKQRISILNREALIHNFLYPKSEWPNFRKALDKFLPLIAKPEDYVGQTIELAKFPSLSSPPGEFTIEAYNRDNGLISLTHPSGLKITENASKLFKSQIRQNLFIDIQTHIINDQPVLVFTNDGKNKLLPILVTQISMADLSIAGIAIGREQLFTLWFSAKNIEGIPLSIDTTNIPLEGEGLKGKHFTIGTFLDTYSDDGKPQIFTLKVAGDMKVLPSQIQFSRDLQKPSQSNHWHTFANSKNENNDSSKNSFLQKMDEIRLSLEPNGFYRDRAFVFIGTSRAQSHAFENRAKIAEGLLSIVKNYDNSGFFSNGLTPESPQRKNFEKALERLPTSLSEIQWYLQNHHDGKQEATILVHEILETIQRYQVTIPKFQNAYQNNPYLRESLNVFFQERLVLLTQIVQKIGVEQNRLEESRQKLEAVLTSGLAIAEKYNLPLIPANNFITHYEINDNKYKHGPSYYYKSLGHGGKKVQDLINVLFTSEVHLLEQKFSAKPEDFEKTFRIGKDKPWRNTFKREFTAFMEQHGALYILATDQLVLGYDETIDNLLTVSREGYVNYIPLESFPQLLETSRHEVGSTGEKL